MSEIIITEDGSRTLIHSVLGELYHSSRGAVGESQHVFISSGLEFLVENGKCNVTIFEVGFGSGLNCWLTLQAAKTLNVDIKYIAVELYPIDMQTVDELNYSSDLDFLKLHTSEWDGDVVISDNFKLCKYQTSLQEFDFTKLCDVDLVYYDAFAPDVQPDLWSVDIFRKIYNSMSKGGVVVTYTSKGEVKRAMREVGFDVVRLKGALGKRHMVRAIK